MLYENGEFERIRPHLMPLECGIIFDGIPEGAISRKVGLIWGIPAEMTTTKKSGVVLARLTSAPAMVIWAGSAPALTFSSQERCSSSIGSRVTRPSSPLTPQGVNGDQTPPRRSSAGIPVVPQHHPVLRRPGLIRCRAPRPLRSWQPRRVSPSMATTSPWTTSLTQFTHWVEQAAK